MKKVASIYSTDQLPTKPGDGPNNPGPGDSTDCVDPMLVDEAEHCIYVCI